MLNQLTLDLDWPVAEVIAPDETLWKNKGLWLEYPGDSSIDPNVLTNAAYFDFRGKRVKDFTFGWSDTPDTIHSINNVEITSEIDAVTAKKKSNPKLLRGVFNIGTPNQ